MKTLYIDCGMGAAGDMLTAALLELLPEKEREEFIRRFNALGIPGVEMRAEPSVKCGITGTHVSILVNGKEEAEGMHTHIHPHTHSHEHSHEHTHEHTHEHEHGHAHAHGHTHSHNGMHEIEHLVRDHLDLSPFVTEDVLAVYSLIAEAESHAHGVQVSEIHFHEVGTMDAVADVTAVCMLMEEIGADQIVVSPINTGSGTVRCAHGVLPVPAPATAYILTGLPTYSNQIRSELCTPTGAALLRHFATDYGSMPVMRTERIGYGMGKKDFETANCVRILLGDTVDAGQTTVFHPDDTPDTVTELVCNLDDMTPEEIGFAMEALLGAGALDVWTQAIGMKKSRPGIMLSVLVRPEDKEMICGVLFRHTTTIGIRMRDWERAVLTREITEEETPFGTVRRKTVRGFGIERSKREYEDLAAIARENDLSLRAVRELLDHVKEKQ